jgi:RimJ/RimL family protein N-acetyltransferase
LVDGEPIACAGFQECWEGRAIAWAILGETAGRHMRALTRAVRRALERHPAERIEAQALVGFAPAMRWARLLGFVPEGVLRKFHQGRDYQAFVFLKGGEA